MRQCCSPGPRLRQTDAQLRPFIIFDDANVEKAVNGENEEIFNLDFSERDK